METTTVSSDVTYASFWTRLGAYIIDLIITGIPSIVLYLVLTMVYKKSTDSMEYNVISQSVSIAIVIFYYSFFEASSYQGSWGKQILEIKVTDMEGERIDMGTAFTRSLVKAAPALVIFASLFAFGMPKVIPGQMPDFTHPYMLTSTILSLLTIVFYLLAAFTARRQALHDMIAGTVVIKKFSVEKEW